MDVFLIVWPIVVSVPCAIWLLNIWRKRHLAHRIARCGVPGVGILVSCKRDSRLWPPFFILWRYRPMVEFQLGQERYICLVLGAYQEPLEKIGRQLEIVYAPHIKNHVILQNTDYRFTYSKDYLYVYLVAFIFYIPFFIVALLAFLPPFLPK